MTAIRHLVVATLATLAAAPLLADSSPVVDTAQTRCYGEHGDVIRCPERGRALFGQDAQHEGHRPSYRDNGDGTVSDLVTGLMWQAEPEPKMTFAVARKRAAEITTGGHRDWRLPTIDELYSLILFSGSTGRSAAASVPYLDTSVFAFSYGDERAGERFIDAQYWSATEYLGTTMGGNPTVFGVNFADGRIKGYPRTSRRGEMRAFVRYVRGNPDYGRNHFEANGDGTANDHATGLMWTVADSGEGLTWAEALAWVEALNRRSWLGHADWRLPNAKELQSLVDYRRSPSATGSAAIDPLFTVTLRADGEVPYYWTSTTHVDGPHGGDDAVYIAFGRALGFLRQPPWSPTVRRTDVHGAGAQRSDPKTGDPTRFPTGRGPQGDEIRILNAVRPVRDLD